MAADEVSPFSSNRASYSQRQVTQEQLRATQEELATKIRELQIYEANYIQLKKELTRWKKKFEYIFRENELLSVETAKLDASHKQIAFLQQEIKFKEEESEALRGLVSALEASNKKARASRLDSAARLAGRKDLPAAAAAGAAVLDRSNSVIAPPVGSASPGDVDAALEDERRARAAEKERLQSEISALKSESSMLLKDLDRRDAALQLCEDKVAAHKQRIATLERALQDEQDKHMQQLREKQDRIAELETNVQQLERRRRSSAVARDENGNGSASADFGPTHRLNQTQEERESQLDEEPDTPPGTPPPISAGGLLPTVDPLADQIFKDWEEDRKIRAAPSAEFDWERIETFIRKLPFEAKEGAERILKQVLNPDDYPDVSESQMLIRAIPIELKHEMHEFLVPLLKAHKHIRVTYATSQRRTLVTDVRLTLEPRGSEYTGGIPLHEKRFGRDHMFFGPSAEDVAKLVLHTTRSLSTEKKAIYVSKPQESADPRSASNSDLETPTTPQDAPGGDRISAAATAEGGSGTPPLPPVPPTAEEKATAAGKKWRVPVGITGKTKKLMGTMVAGAKQRVAARLAQSSKYVHEGSSCQFCKVSPIVGHRYSCATCVGFDLCEGCYSLGGHGFENSDELFYRTQEIVLARCPRLADELDLLELLRFEICRSNLRKFGFCLNWLADIINGKTSQQLQARALEIPGIRRDIRKQFVPLLLRVCSDREDLEVKTEWELESDNSAEVKSVAGNGGSSGSGGRSSLNEGDGRFLETLRIWVADQYRTTSPFVERSLLKFREGMAVEGDSEEENEEGEDQYAQDEVPSVPQRTRAATTSSVRDSNGSDHEERVASSRRGFTERNRVMSQEF